MSLYRSRHVAARFVPSLFTLFVRTYLRPQVKGLETLPREGPLLLAANHSSHADTAVVFTSLPREMRQRFVAAAAQDYFFRGGPMQFWSRVLFNAVPVTRERMQRGQDPLRHLVRALREDHVVMIFPEGTRSKDGALGQFRNGIGRLIAEFPHVPVIPIWLGGTAKAMPKGKFMPRPVSVDVRFGAPLYLNAQPKVRATWQAAANQIRDTIIELSEGAALNPIKPLSAGAPMPAEEQQLEPDE